MVPVRTIPDRARARKRATIVIVAVALILVKFLFCLLPSDAIDMPGYRAWSRHLATRGFADFYQTWHVVYAPAYMYLLWLSGIAAKFFKASQPGHEFLIKIWPALFDLLGGLLILNMGTGTLFESNTGADRAPRTRGNRARVCANLRMFLLFKKRGYAGAEKEDESHGCGLQTEEVHESARLRKKRLGLILGAAYALNPAVIFNSSVWGQFESVAATTLFASVYCLQRRWSVSGVLLFLLAVLVKPQSAILAPLVLVLFLKDAPLRKFWPALAGSILLYLAVVMPFSAGRPVYWIFTHFLESGGDYPYATANAFNLWTILGGQTIPDYRPFLGLTYAGWGLLLIVLATAGVIWFLWRRPPGAPEVYYAAYFLCFAVFMLGTRMHERYLFPALIFLTAAVLWEKKLLIPLITLSLCHFGNTFYIYLRGWWGRIWAPRYDWLALTIAGITLGVFVHAVYYLARAIKRTYTRDEVANDGATGLKTKGGAGF